MNFRAAVESVIPGEHFDRLTVTRERYGLAVQLVAFHRRWFLDVIRK